MSKRSYFCGGSMLAVALTMGGFQAAQAADAPTTKVEEVVVTGSYIAGTPEDAALPVTVLSADTLQKQGSPSPVEMMKSLPEAAGIIGESNQFTAGRGQGAEGLGSINLRGLGPERTLVLLNGHRLPLAAGTIVDSIALPQSAIGRVEVLKDGAAATYGSDAIGGVVNFITKKNVRGLEVGGDFRRIRGSGGDWTLNATWGTAGDGWDGFVSGAYQFRSHLPVVSRSWAHVPYETNPEGGWSGSSMPTEFTPAILAGGALVPAPAAFAAPFVDTACARLGGVLTGNAVTPAGTGASNCRTQFSVWDNLEEEQKSYQLYGEFNWNAPANSKLHAELEYAWTDIPHANTTPSFATTRPVPSTVLPANYLPALFVAGTSPPASFLYFVPASNPGFAAYQAANPTQLPAGVAGAFITVGNWRPYMVGGNPLFNGGPSFGVRHHEQWRGSVDWKGDFGAWGASTIGWDANLTYGRYKFWLAGYDSLTDRLELALRGLGGPNCNFQTGAPGVGGCQYFNPFSNGIPNAPRSGLTSNSTFNPAVANTADLTAWFFPYQWSESVSQFYEGNFILNGKLGAWTLPGGDIGWAAGAQWRHNEFKSTYSTFASAVASPCSDTPLTGLLTCNPSSGPNVFLGVGNPQDLSQDIYAGFAEVSLPVTDKLDFDLAARYEDYGNNGGSTFNPQLRVKWQAVDWLAFRGSVGTTFRAPPQGLLITDPATSLQSVLGAFRPVDTIGNPNLKPEKATVFSVGAIVQAGPFRATVDYWNYHLKQVITSEPLTSVVNALFPTGAANNCGTLDPAFIASHFTFAGPCGPGAVTKVTLLRINGPDIKNDGVDFNASYRLSDNVWGGSLTLGAVGTWVHKYDVSALQIGTVTVPAFSAVGFFNSGLIAYPLPEWKGQVYAEFNNGPLNVRWTVRYTDSYIDQRTALFGFNSAYKTPINQAGIVPGGQKIKAIALSDVAVRYFGPWDTTWTLAVNNVFDQDPPFARTEINYDALTGDPLGLTVKLGLQKKF